MDRIETLSQFLRQNPADSFTRYGLALEYVNIGQTDKGLQEFATLIELNPDYTAAYQMAAQTLMKQGRDNDARKLLEDGVACALRTGNLHAQREMEGLLDSLGT